MLIRQWPLQSKILVIFGLIAVVLLTIIVITFLTVFNYQEQRERITHTNQVLDTLDATLNSITDAETGQRGYLLTGDARYLEPFNSAVANLPHYLNDLKNLNSDNTVQEQRAEALSSLVNDKLAELKETISLRQSDGLEAALKLVLTNEGKRTMDSIRQNISTLKIEENRLLQERARSQDTNDTHTLLSVSVLVLFNAAFFILIYYLVVRDLKRQEQVESEIRGLNVKLEKRVDERTNELAIVNQNLEYEVIQREMALNRLRLLSEISTVLAASFDYEEILQQVANHTLLYPGDYCLIDLADKSEASSFQRVAIATADKQKEAQLRKIEQENPPDWSTLPRLVQDINEDGPVVTSSPQLSVRTPDGLETEQLRLFQHIKPLSAISVPFRVRNHLLGMLSVVNDKRENCYSYQDLALVEEIVNRLKVALDNAYLYNQTQKDLNTQRELDYYKDLFMAVASHELRTPLTSIKGYAQIMQRSLLGHTKIAPNAPPDPARLLRSVDTILYQSDRMNDLVDQLLNFSRIQNRQLELKYTPDLNLNQLIKRVVDQHRQNPKEHQFALQLPERPLVGNWDGGRLEQVLDNLINNALKYSPAGTTVTLGLEPSRHENNGSGPEALIWVRDEGQGISEQEQAHIFDLFYRVPNGPTAGTDGLGLGLYVSNEIIRQHGGRMWLESQPGKGSTFYLSLPLTPVF